MVYKLFYTRSAEQDLERIDRQEAVKILKMVNEYAAMENPLIKAKKLKGFSMDTYRFRDGDYRIIFRLDKVTKQVIVLVVLKVAHRRVVYR